MKGGSSGCGISADDGKGRLAAAARNLHQLQTLLLWKTGNAGPKCSCGPDGRRMQLHSEAEVWRKISTTPLFMSQATPQSSTSCSGMQVAHRHPPQQRHQPGAAEASHRAVGHGANRVGGASVCTMLLKERCPVRGACCSQWTHMGASGRSMKQSGLALMVALVLFHHAHSRAHLAPPWSDAE